ncbi:MAG: hypothetical protein DMD96_17060 [Candidatus Rokuibacteriota bacterium]|nr:MAG: hypothetical protein DMD96_17060 [Candidatus Rokubacteria bacterium]
MDTTTQERTMRGFEPSMLASDAAIGATQRVIGDLTELSIGAAKENARLAAELQIAAIDALQESHAAALRWHTLWPKALVDPLHVYQKAFMETVDTTQRALSLMGANAKVVVQSIDRLQAAAMDTGRRVRETLTTASGMREATRRS